MADKFSGLRPGLESPVENGFAVTTNDGSDLAYATRGIYVGASGHLKVDLVGGDTVTFNDIAAGIIHPIRATRIYATGTTATSIIAVY